MTNERINKLKKVELHLHLDGSITRQYVKDKYNLSDEEINSKMVASKKCQNLNDYLECFDFPISIMQTEQELKDITIDLLNNLKEQNIIYAEIRFAPQFHTKNGLTQEDVLKAVLSARDSVDIKSNFILCVMRGKDNIDENYETVNLAKKYLRKGVCAIDLAGAEAIFKTSEYHDIFEYAKKLDIPFTIHAGEADGPTSIKDAISYGAKRIGHGVRAIEDEKLLKEIIKEGIYLEVCPTSNIQTCICDTYSTHPIEKLYKMGVKTTINTDNMTVSNTTLDNEYEKLLEETDLEIKDIINMNINSINAAFISNEEKEKLMEEIKSENK